MNIRRIVTTPAVVLAVVASGALAGGAVAAHQLAQPIQHHDTVRVEQVAEKTTPTAAPTKAAAKVVAKKKAAKKKPAQTSKARSLVNTQADPEPTDQPADDQPQNGAAHVPGPQPSGAATQPFDGPTEP